MLTYFLGPFLALLPKRWRNSFFAHLPIEWLRASVLSGFGEAVIALAALMYWYSYYMAVLVDRGLDSALTGKLGPRVMDQEIGFTALAIWATHPLTWLLAYVGVEGAVRLVGAAFTETNLGTFPLFLLEKIITRVSANAGPSVAQADGYSQGNFSSYVGAIKEKAILSRLGQVPDELVYVRSQEEEMLEIRACRRKADWDPPRTVRYQDVFYRLEGYSAGAAPRPFRYTLRKLSAGVMSRTVLVYSPDEVPVVAMR